MKIARFMDFDSAQDKLSAYNALAISPTSSSDFALTTIYKHTTRQCWWFNVDDCINNGGLYKDDIALDVNNLITTDINQEQLIAFGYMPQPSLEVFDEPTL